MGNKCTRKKKSHLSPETALRKAVHDRNVSEVKQLLPKIENINARPDDDPDKDTYLMICARTHSDGEIAQLLVEAGADFTLTGHNGQTAFHMACRDQDAHAEVLETLLKLAGRPGACDAAYLDVKNAKGNTALYEAQEVHNSPRCALLLRDAGAHVRV